LIPAESGPTLTKYNLGPAIGPFVFSNGCNAVSPNKTSGTQPIDTTKPPRDENAERDTDEDLDNTIAVFTGDDVVEYWLEEQKLYQKLQEDVTYRNSSTALQAYYIQLRASNIGKLHAIHHNFARMSDASLAPYLSGIILLEIQQQLNSIIAGKPWELLEKEMLQMQLKATQMGMASITEEEAIEIETTAFSCPLINGSAVWCARQLHLLQHPAQHYDDRYLCSNTANKGGDNSLDFEKSITVQQEETAIAPNTMRLYPNPAKNIVTLSYAFTAKEVIFTLYNAIGQLVYTTYLPISENHYQIDVNNLPSGIYTYQIQTSNCPRLSGTLHIIQKY
jgi:hypothetical protein